jgi:hypothetical protein
MDATPALLDFVRLANRGTLYLVVSTDPDKKLVDLVSITGPQHMANAVPVSDLREIEVTVIDDD